MSTRKYEARKDTLSDTRYDVPKLPVIATYVNDTIKYDPDIYKTIVIEKAFGANDPTTNVGSGKIFIDKLKLLSEQDWLTAIQILSPHLVNSIRSTLHGHAEIQGVSSLEISTMCMSCCAWNMASYKLEEENFIFEGRGSLNKFLTNIGRYTVFNLMKPEQPVHKKNRKNIEHEEVDDSIPDCGESVETKALNNVQYDWTCKDAKEILPRKSYEIFRSFNIDLQMEEEIAHQHNVTEETVKRNLKRSYEKLGNHIRVHDQEMRADQNGLSMYRKL